MEFSETGYSLALGESVSMHCRGQGSTVKIIFALVTPDHDAAIGVIPAAAPVINPAADTAAAPGSELFPVL